MSTPTGARAQRTGVVRKGKPERKPGAQSYRSKDESLGQRDCRSDGRAG